MTSTSAAQAVIAFIEGLAIPEGPKSGESIRLAPFQKKFLRGALKASTQVAVLSVARGNGKSALTAGLALAELLGVFDGQPRREILCAARTREQAKIIFHFIQGLAASLPDEVQEMLTFRRAPHVEIEYDGDGGGHIVRCISADPKNALGAAPVLAIMDERGHWPDEKGDDLESALLSGLGKRGGRCVIISSSAPSDSASLSKWIDEPPEGTFVMEFRAPDGLPADDPKGITAANPGAKYGIGSSPKWLKAQAQRAIARGGSALSSFRLYNLNQRVSGENRDVLLTVDDWLGAEVSELPPREGPCVVGIDLGGSASMSAAALYWYESGRLECVGAFPTTPSLANRGQRDGVRDRYVQMAERGELVTMGQKVVPVGEFLKAIMDRLDGETPACIVGDRYRQSEFEEAMMAANLRVPVIYRGFGFKDGGEDCERLRQAVFDGHVKSLPSLLLRSAFSDAVVLRDPANNLKLAKARSLGRIDAAAATVVAVAEGRRRAGRTIRQARGPIWA